MEESPVTTSPPKIFQPSIARKPSPFEWGYENFPPHLLHFQQAMPLFTQAKWDRMYTEGKTSFCRKICDPKLAHWLETWFAQQPAGGGDDKGVEHLFVPSLFCHHPPNRTSPILPPSSLRGLATGWIEVIGGYVAWSPALCLALYLESSVLNLQKKRGVQGVGFTMR